MAWDWEKLVLDFWWFFFTVLLAVGIYANYRNYQMLLRWRKVLDAESDILKMREDMLDEREKESEAKPIISKLATKTLSKKQLFDARREETKARIARIWNKN